MRKLIFFSILILIFGPMVFLAIAMEPAPAVSTATSATGTDATRAKSVLKKFWNVTGSGTGKRTLEVSQQDMNSVLAFAARAVPTLRGEAQITPDEVRVTSSLRVPGIPGGRWLNLHVGIAPSDRGLHLASMRLGDYSLPAGMVLPVVRVAMDLVLGDGVGTIAVNAIDGVSIDAGKVTVGVALNRTDRKALTGRLKATARSIANISSPQDVRAYYLAIDAAVTDGRLKSKGSTVPYLRYAMELTGRKSQGSDVQAEVQSALLALAIFCGHYKFERLIGDVVPENMRGKRTGCAGTTLGGRKDLRQHFVISAGLQAASNEGAAFTIGEFKELLDSAGKGSGFSFDDLAADRAGIRFATALLETEAQGRQALVGRLGSERSVFPSIAGLPAGLSQGEFERRFGTVDSTAYRDMLKTIEQRIDALPFFAAL